MISHCVFVQTKTMTNSMSVRIFVDHLSLKNNEEIQTTFSVVSGDVRSGDKMSTNFFLEEPFFPGKLVQFRSFI